MSSTGTKIFLGSVVGSADFSANIFYGAVSLTVEFQDRSTASLGITSYSWNFGDGTVSSEQNPTHVYQRVGFFTVSLTIVHPFGTLTETKTNYIQVVAKIPEIYNMILQSIRTADAERSSVPFLLKRYLEGPQQIFDITQTKIKELLNLMNYRDCPDDLLQYLKPTVGFTSDLDYITGGLTSTMLRKVILLATAMWKEKGLELGLRNMLRLFTGKEVKVYDWFKYRWIIDESQLGQSEYGDVALLSRYEVEGTRTGQGTVPTTFGWVWVLKSDLTPFFQSDVGAFMRISNSAKGYNGIWYISAYAESATYHKLQLENLASIWIGVDTCDWEITPWDQFTTDIKIERADHPQEQTTNRLIIRDVLPLVRPASERFRVLYYQLLEHFELGLGNWDYDKGSAIILNDVLNLDYDTRMYETGRLLSTVWTDQMITCKFKITNPPDFDFYFFMQNQGDFDDCYRVFIEVVQDRIDLFKFVGGTPTQLFTNTGYGLAANEDYVLRIDAIKDDTSGDTIIKVYLDGEKICEVADSAFYKGTVGFASGLNAKVDVDFIEVFGNPWDVDYITK